ncbi:MAG: transposase [Nocardioides sp.]
MDVVVLTVDQDSSRQGPDQVPAGLAALDHVPTLLAFERTAGDEFQGVLDDPAAVAAALEPLIRAGEWNIGIGIGEIETPLPDLARAGRGSAYVRAREAVTAAKSSPWRVRAAGDGDEARPLESAVWLWAALLSRRTPRGWEVADLVDSGLTYEQAGSRIGISQSAVSQRAAAAGIAEGRRARELVTHLARLALRGAR